ncbi:MAG: cyanophycin synthetase, partial [Candidatus Limnocylindrales bacterium]
MTRTSSDIGAGLAPAREPRPISAGERIHVIGAGGAGASAAALLAHSAGATVTGCDIGGPSPYTAALVAAAIHLDWAHDPAHVADDNGRGAPLIDRLAVTKALTSVAPDHPELLAARRAGVPVESWQQLVADAAATTGQRLVAIAGTHGKSTSSGWLVHVLVEAGGDPSAFVGALLPGLLTGGLPSTARLGSGDVFVVEADEYAGNFDAYRPSLAVLLNAEWDHPDVFGDESAVIDAFEAWLRLPGAEQRTVIVNASDRGAALVSGRLTDWPGQIVDVGDEQLATGIRLSGGHNLTNARCVAAAARELGVPEAAIDSGIASYGGVGRRMEVKGEVGGVTVIDDYAHHPTAIAATLQAVRDTHPDKRIWAVYEPLTFHRTAAMLDAFADVLATADHAVIADIWAGRDPDTTITSPAALADAVSRRASQTATAPGSVEATAAHLLERVGPGDVVLV